MPCASPKDATSTPSSFSLVDRSAPVKGRVPGRDGRGGRLGLLVTGRDQPVDPAVGGQRALADREDVRVGDGAALLVDADAAALADREAAVPGQLVAGPHTGAEHHEFGGEFGAVGQLHAGDGAVVAGHDLLRADARVDGQAHVLDGAQQRGAAALVDLHRHQARRELHDVRGESESLERTGRLQAEQPAADHGAGRDLRAYSSMASRSSIVR
ncbi:hypothetical protein STENM223S_01660 [Streptomyces tendae]